MATYRNRNNDTIIWGSEFKLNVNMEPIDNYHMGDVDFFCTFMSGGKSVVVTKSQMRKVDDDNYVAPLDSKELGRGYINIRYEAEIPDDDFSEVGDKNEFRHEIVLIQTKIKIV